MFILRPFLRNVLVATLVVTAGMSWAEMQNVRVGGEIRIRANAWDSSFNGGVAPLLVGREVRWPAATLQKRPIGDFLGGQNALSFWDWDSKGPEYRNVIERTTFNVEAAFTDGVRAYIEFDSVDVWGEDFRSNYITGADARGAADIELYQSFIETTDTCGAPLRLRLGRQELVFGGGWLLGNGTRLPEFTGLSYDAVRATYALDALSIDAFAAKLAERSPLEQDGDTDLYGLYGSYTGIENVSLDAFWFLLRDAQSLSDTQSAWLSERIEDFLGLDNYDPTTLHTIGLRGAGHFGALDFTGQAAYQFGDANAVGFLFNPLIYGDDSAEYDAWAAHAEMGYALETLWNSRVFLGGAYFSGEDNRSISFIDWMNPFLLPTASVSFNRLFSDEVYSYFIDEMGQLSNFWTAWGGITARPTDNTEVTARLAYLSTIEEFDQPIHVRFGRARIALAPALSFWTTESESDLGWELALSGKYQYSEDLAFKAGWSHLFTGDGLADGSFNDFNGLTFSGGTDDDDADYFFLETALKF